MKKIKLILLFFSIMFLLGCSSGQKQIEGVSPEFSKDVWEVINDTTNELKNLDLDNEACTVGKSIMPFTDKWEYNISTPKEQEIYDIIADSTTYIFANPTNFDEEEIEWSLKNFKESKFKLEELIKE